MQLTIVSVSLLSSCVTFLWRVAMALSVSESVLYVGGSSNTFFPWGSRYSPTICSTIWQKTVKILHYGPQSILSASYSCIIVHIPFPKPNILLSKTEIEKLVFDFSYKFRSQ